MKATVVKILTDSGYYVAAGKVDKANSIGEVTGIIGKDVKSDTKGIEIRKLYNEVRQKYIDIKDGKDDGAYFISNPDAAKTMNQAQKEFAMAADLSKLYRESEDKILQERKISRADLEKAKNQDFSRKQYEIERMQFDKNMASGGGRGTSRFAEFDVWKANKRKVAVNEKTPLAELNKRLAEHETSKKLFYNITPNKDLMKTKEGDYSWGALSTGIMSTALQEGVKLTGQEGTFPLWGQQLGKLAEKNEDDLKDVEIDNVLSVSSQGLATVKFKKGNKDDAPTIIGTVQLNPEQTALWMGNKNTDTRFSDMIKRNKTSGALNTMYKGIVVPYEIGYNPTLDAFQITVRRGNNPRAVKQSGEPYTAKRAEELEVAMEEQMKLIYQRMIADGIPKEKWVDYAADVLTNTIKSDPKAYK